LRHFFNDCPGCSASFHFSGVAHFHGLLLSAKKLHQERHNTIQEGNGKDPFGGFILSGIHIVRKYAYVQKQANHGEAAQEAFLYS
jgi:hypothetical protein